MSERKTVRRRPAGVHDLPAADQATTPAEEAPEQPRAKRERMDLGELQDLANLDPNEFARLLDGAPTQFEPGDEVEGTVTRVGREAFFVDVGGKSEAIMERGEQPDVAVGDKVKAFVIEAGEDGLRISRRLSGPAAAAMIAAAHESGVPVEGRVLSANKGGFDVKVGGIRAFCPISHMDRMRIEDPQIYVGGTYTFQVIEVEDKIVVSRRALLAKDAEALAETFWASVEPGDEHRGVVTSVQSFGIFVDVGGVDGLVPRGELGWGEQDPSRFQPGQPLEVRVIGVDKDKRKLTLSAKDPGQSPWSQVGTAFSEGGTYEGRVVNVTHFGAFVELAPGLQGLLHKSRLPKSGGLPKEGETMTVRLDNVDYENQRLSLSHPDAGAGKAAPQGDDGSWRSAKRTSGSDSFGTFADLLKGAGED